MKLLKDILGYYFKVINKSIKIKQMKYGSHFGVADDLLLISTDKASLFWEFYSGHSDFLIASFSDLCYKCLAGFQSAVYSESTHYLRIF